ncbi:DUF2975 domain-containing protein [Gracilimonas sp.]|uniref:DUF2975 domain-containing protein n=1 Tax=Gracilimonas sp. TaxID=1974203 RepID=UPI003BAA31DD
METLKNKHSVYYSYLIVNFLWYALLLLAAFFAIISVGEHFFGNLIDGFNITVPIDPSSIVLNSSIDTSNIELKSANATFDSSYIKEISSGLYVGLMISLAVGITLFLYGFYQLRMILKSVLSDRVFIPENIKRLKVIAGLLIIFEPLSWLVYRLFVMPIDSITAANQLSISLDFEPGNLIYGLLIFALAAVFEKGHEMYQELKLTV